MFEIRKRGSRGFIQKIDRTVWAGLLAVMAFFVGAKIIAYRNIVTLRDVSDDVTRTHEVLSALDDVMSQLTDAETGQRGYLLTGDERYLTPYYAAMSGIDTRIIEVKQLTADNAEQQRQLIPVEQHIAEKRKELEEVILLRRHKGLEAALAVVTTDRGKAAMDAVRAGIKVMEATERRLREQRMRVRDEAFHAAMSSGLSTGILGVVLTGLVGILLGRTAAARRQQEWQLRAQTGLSEAMRGEQRLDELCENALRFLSDYLGALAGAMFVKDGSIFKRAATFGVPDGGVPERFSLSDGLLGQAAKENRMFSYNNVPEGYLAVGSALGRGTPKHLLIMPSATEGDTRAVLELGFADFPPPGTDALLERAGEAVAIAIRSANYRAHLQNLLEETQRQAEELQAQQEELRVSNEELEEQGRALKESSARLEEQQAELEQTNARLEEQAHYLAAQRDDLARAKSSLTEQAHELEQASQYKSDFLANMSHELRTPLNSSLILAKLLADNTGGNLTEEQVRYAETIQSAGNDLLILINDILDLSKIEAGKMDIRPETVDVRDFLAGLMRTFEPMAKQKGLVLNAEMDPGAPSQLETDRVRLEQVVKNLLSNALKFTQAGSVTVRVGGAPGEKVAISVIDTGIGISAAQHELIFDAFRQADGTTNRKYGGTGLGLSISRQLARLLGGDVSLQSEVGGGSTFTVLIPIRFDPSLSPTPLREQPTHEVPDHIPVARGLPGAAPTAWGVGVEPAGERRDVRAGEPVSILPDKRVILIVEDDTTFSEILCDLARELDFQCLIANTAEQAVAMAGQYLPSAVVLDIGLPDHSGLSVLDRLKHDARTRHIPVHVVSASDYAETALSLGAVGYLLKPVKREELADALRKLEARLEKHVRRVLIVEDDAVQRDGLKKLLASSEVETVGAATAAECLNHLRSQTFDCMVLDLSLPDASGYTLLETLSREHAYSFPPVIVYTGRDLSADEEQSLRRYSKSIIIKGAKSPERLLDEVTLFLHQVVSDLPAEQRRMLERARSRDAALEGRRILVVEDDVRNVFALTSILEPRGASVEIARNGREALAVLERTIGAEGPQIDLVLMDVMMPEMDGLTATREIRKRAEWKRLPVIMLTAKAMKDDQERCLDAGANDYMAKPLDVEKLLSLVRVWMPR